MHRMLKHRLISGSLLIAVTVGLLLVDDYLQCRRLGPAGLITLALALLISTLATRELVGMFASRGVTLPVWICVGGSWAVIVSAWWLGTYAAGTGVSGLRGAAIFASVLALVLGVVMVAPSVVFGRTQGIAAMAGGTLLSVAYLGVLPAFYVMIRAERSAGAVLAVILVAKCCDIGAYFTGRAVGRHKLAPMVSPGKTWEGLAGGVVLSVVAAAVASRWLDLTTNLWLACVGGAVIGVVAQVSDLVASALKRDAQVKDSGTTVPGIGGVIDLIDSPFGVAPVGYWLILIARM